MRDLAISLLEDQQAEDVLCVATKGILDYTDYLVLATGRSSRHQLAMAQKLQLELKKKSGVKPVLEGDSGSTWLVLDCDCLVIHLQLQDKREYYQLASLWFPDEESEHLPTTEVTANA